MDAADMEEVDISTNETYEVVAAAMLPKEEGDKYEYGNAYKGVGNTFFKEKQYAFAIRTYTDCPSKLEKYAFESEVDMMGDPLASTICCQCYSNAAQCSLKLKDWKQALELCEMSLKYYPKKQDKAKVLFRRGQAFMGLGELHKAIHALEAAMGEDPKAAIKKELLLARRKLEHEEKKAAKRLFKGSKKRRDKLKEALGYDEKSVKVREAQESGVSALEQAMDGDPEEAAKALEVFQEKIEAVKEQQITEGTEALVSGTVLNLTFGAAFASYVKQDWAVAARYFKDLLAKTVTKVTTTAANAAANMPRDSATTLGMSFDMPTGPHDAKGGAWVETEVWGEKLAAATKPLGDAVALNAAAYTFYQHEERELAGKFFRRYLEAAEKAGEQECIHNLPDGWQGRKITPKDRKVSKWRYHVHTKASRFDAYCILGRMALDASYERHQEEGNGDEEETSEEGFFSGGGHSTEVVAHAMEAIQLHELALVLAEKPGQRVQVQRSLAAAFHVAGKKEEAEAANREAEKAAEEEKAEEAKKRKDEEEKQAQEVQAKKAES